MTAGELIAALRRLPPNTEVIIQADSEGNDFSPLAGIWTGSYRANPDSANGQMGLARLTKEDRAQGFTEEDVIHDGVFAVALYPMA